MTAPLLKEFEFVREHKDRFLGLFPHRFDYIYATHPEPGEKPNWLTECRHPLSDRLIQRGEFLFGVRFGAKTHYCLLDIDIGSFYHPQKDPLAIAQIISVLEEIGLVSYVACTSSSSGGLHLYFPFHKAQNSWELASAITTVLDHAGFKLIPGQLELFPNPKPYITEGKPSLLNGHRLPLQNGSYLVNQDFQPIWADRSTFLKKWKFAQDRNNVEVQVIKQIIKQKTSKRWSISGKADKFLNDLTTEIELGWTGFGQTNRLLGRITMREYIFHHIINGGDPLTGEALVQRVVSVAKALPGYKDWCRHQHEIRHRVEEWVNCIQNSHYYPYGETLEISKTNNTQTLTDKKSNEPTQPLPNSNQVKSEIARERIRCAIANLLEENRLPHTATDRFKVLTQEYKIGGGTLYRHKELWHPKALGNADMEKEKQRTARDQKRKSSITSLFVLTVGNAFPDASFDDFTLSESLKSVGNFLASFDSVPSSLSDQHSYGCLLSRCSKQFLCVQEAVFPSDSFSEGFMCLLMVFSFLVAFSDSVKEDTLHFPLSIFKRCSCSVQEFSENLLAV